MSLYLMMGCVPKKSNMCSAKAFTAEVQAVRGCAVTLLSPQQPAEGKADDLVFKCLLALYFWNPSLFFRCTKRQVLQMIIPMLPLISFKCFSCHQEKYLMFGLYHQGYNLIQYIIFILHLLLNLLMHHFQFLLKYLLSGFVILQLFLQK